MSKKLANAADILEDMESAPEEHYLVGTIKTHLLTPAQKQALFDADMDIADCLNGRYNEDKWNAFVRAMYHDWNQKLGVKHFGSNDADPYECFPDNERPAAWDSAVDAETLELIAKLKEKMKKYANCPLALSTMVREIGYLEHHGICAMNDAKKGCKKDPYA